MISTLLVQSVYMRDPLREYNSMRMALPVSINGCIRKTVSKLGSFGIRDFVSKDLAESATYLLKYPGKLLRPTLVFLGAMYTGRANVERYVDLAVAIELLHTSSLIHDDIVDMDSVRRGVESVHVRYGQENAVLAGDALIAKAIKESCKYGASVVDSISSAAMDMCAGEVIDFNYQKRNAVPSVRSYLLIASLKSCSVIGASASIAALHSSKQHVDELHQFGNSLGMAFQIRDDIIDFVEDGGVGKNGAREFRPNIVRSLQTYVTKNRTIALKRAKELNHYYVEKAIGRITERGNGKLLRRCAEAIRFSE